MRWWNEAHNQIQAFYHNDQSDCFFVFLSWFLNDRFLERFYLFNKKNSLIQTHQTINNLYREDSADIELELEKLESAKGVRIIVADKKFKIKYASFFQRG